LCAKEGALEMEMSKQKIEEIRLKLAAEREEKFRSKLAALVAEIEYDKMRHDEFVNEILVPAVA
jgi:hypothetical protein